MPIIHCSCRRASSRVALERNCTLAAKATTPARWRFTDRRIVRDRCAREQRECARVDVPGSALESIWRLNPQAQSALGSLGGLGILLMSTVCATCSVACSGLVWRRPWGYWVALAILCVNVVADATNALVRGDLRTLIGVPIGIALIMYLRRERIATLYSAVKHSDRDAPE
jgi:hypothetical protein